MHLNVTPGDAVFHVIAGSGGHGDARTRDPAQVAADVRDEKVSIERAESDYGVVIEPGTLLIDEVRTARLRAQWEAS